MGDTSIPSGFCRCKPTPRTQIPMSVCSPFLLLSLLLFFLVEPIARHSFPPSILSQQGKKESGTSRERIPIYFGPMFHNFHLADPPHRRAESLPRRREKVTRACERCRTFRIKCGEKKPCSQCMNEKVRCVFSSLPSTEEQEQEPTSPVLAGYESSLDVKL